MKKKVPFIIGAVLLLICAAAVICFWLTQYSGNHYDMPAGAWRVTKNYLSDYKVSTVKSVEHMYWGDRQDIREVYKESGGVLYDYQIDSVDKINDNLYSLTLEMKSSTSDGEWKKVYNFVGYIDGKWYYMNTVDLVPEEISEKLDPSLYDYGDNSMSINEVVIMPVEDE